MINGGSFKLERDVRAATLLLPVQSSTTKTFQNLADVYTDVFTEF